MNARQQQLQLTVESRQVRDATLCVFHTVLLHRTLGKLLYRTDVDYMQGTVGTEEVDCEEIDLTYVRVNSPELVADVDERVGRFEAEVRSLANGDFSAVAGSSPQSPTKDNVRLYGIHRWENLFEAQVKLEFYQRRKQTLMGESRVPWEIWELRLDVVRTRSFEDFLLMREFVGEKLADVVMSICQRVNKPQYLPPVPPKAELTHVFYDRFSDCQPYLYRIESRSEQNKSSDTTRWPGYMRSMLRNALTFS